MVSKCLTYELVRSRTMQFIYKGPAIFSAKRYIPIVYDLKRRKNEGDFLMGMQ